MALERRPIAASVHAGTRGAERRLKIEPRSNNAAAKFRTSPLNGGRWYAAIC